MPSTSTSQSPTNERRWSRRPSGPPRTWLPLVFVIAALLSLLLTPLVVNHFINRIRDRRVEPTNNARALLSEFEGSFAEELVLSAAASNRSASDVSHRAEAIATELGTEREMDSLVTKLGGSAARHLADLRQAERSWRVLDSLEGDLPRTAAEQNRRTDVGRQVIDAAKRLHDDLVAISDVGRDEVRRLESIMLGANAALVTIALVAITIVVAMERRIREYASEADDRAQKLERSVELRASLIHGVVHDVKNPLGAASGYTDLLEEGVAGPLTDQQNEMVGRIKRLIGTAVQTVAELVDLARVDAGEYPIEPRDVNLVSVVRRIVDDHQARATMKRISLSFDASPDVIPLRTDPSRVRHVVENLLSNALKYTPDHGVVIVKIRGNPDGRGASISVRDNGPGIPLELRERVFDPFFRIASSEHKERGSGLGLPISRRIARLLGGDVSVTEPQGGGSDFVFTLPAAPPLNPPSET